MRQFFSHVRDEHKYTIQGLKGREKKKHNMPRNYISPMLAKIKLEFFGEKHPYFILFSLTPRCRAKIEIIEEQLDTDQQRGLS